MRRDAQTEEKLGSAVVAMAIGTACAWAERWGVALRDVRAVHARPGGGAARKAWGAEAWCADDVRYASVAPHEGPLSALGALMDRADEKEGA